MAVRCSCAPDDGCNIAPETCRANDERNKEYSVHLVGPELNIPRYTEPQTSNNTLEYLIARVTAL
jgi:hypothetical protein